jgi:gliding motility-associated-like protein
MKRLLLALSIIMFLFVNKGLAQGNQTVNNGASTSAVNFPGTGCLYNWANDSPGIGLAANGAANINSFTAVNTGSSPVIATITATPASSGFAYITNESSNNVSVISTATHSAIATILVGASPWGEAVSPDGTRVYVAGEASNSISVINTATNSVISTIIVGINPFGVVVSPDGSRVYVADGGNDAVTVINTATNMVISTIALSTTALGIAISPDGKWLYVTGNGQSLLSIINTATNGVVTTIPVGSYSSGVVVSPDGSLLYVTNNDANTVMVINTTTNTVVATIPVGASPYGISMLPDGSLLYVANTFTQNVSVINTSTNTVVATIAVNGRPYGISVSPDGKELYVTIRNPDNVTVINTSTNLAANTVNVGSAPISLGNFISAGPGCSSKLIKFTITVNPANAVPPTITATTPSGTISACAGTASFNPQIEQFTISGSNLTGNITATAPIGFEVSLSAGSGYGNSVTVIQTAGAVSNMVVYVRSAATAASGNISGNVTLTSTGAVTQNVGVTGIINALPTVNAVGNQTVGTGSATAAINFTGTATAFSWVNDTPGIGLAAGGAGNIPSFVASNTSNSPVTATITVTPVPSGFAYIANRISNTLSVINIANYQVVATIPLGMVPWGVSVSADGSRVYVTNQGSNTLSVVNTASNSVIATITVGSIPDGVVVSPDGSLVYVANNGSNSVSVINTASNTLSATIAVGVNPTGITTSPDGTKVYVTNETSDNISVINTATNLVVAVIPLTTSCIGASISPDGSTLYVADQTAAFVTVISTATNTVVAQIPVMQAPNGLSINPDGALVYASNSGSNTVSVINTSTNTVIATIPFSAEPFAVSSTPDGTRIFVTNIDSNYVSIINTATNTVVSTILVGSNPNSLGNFITQASICSGIPLTFTITVKPSVLPAIQVDAATGSITACAGTASISPQIQQFTVSGSNLTGNITATAPPGFEVSLNANSGYGSDVSLTPTAGTVSNTVVYVRSSALAAAGNISGNVTLSSAGIASPQVAVTGDINALPVVNALADQTIPNGTATTAVNFTGTGNAFSWVNDTPGIGLPASGTGNIPSFTAVNTGSGPVVATVTVTPLGSTTCTGTAVSFTITVTPTIPATITASGTLPSLTTPYGTPSTSTIFDVSGVSLTAGILVTPPAGFEVSTDDVNFSSTVTVGSAGTLASTQVYIRLAATTPVGDYSGNIALSSTAAPTVNVVMPLSTVTPTLLTIIADNKSRIVNTPNPVLTATYIGFVNNETPVNLTTQPVLTTTAIITSPVAQYPITVNGAASPNYTIGYIDGLLTVLPSALVIPNTFTPNGDGINDTWDIKYLDSYVNCSVDIFTRWGQKVYTSIGYGTPWDGTYKGSRLAVGTYYYIINLKNGNGPLSGFVVIIR